MSTPRRKSEIGVSLGAFLLVIGFLAFVMGLAQFFKLAIEDTSGKDRPVVTAELAETEGGLVLTASILASGLTSDEHVEILVQGLNSRTELSDVVAGAGPRQRDDVANYRDPSTEFDSPQRLHLSRVGGNRDGQVDTTLKVPISIGLYERVRIVATVAKKGGDEDEAQRIRDQEEKTTGEQHLADLQAQFQNNGETAKLSLVAQALGSSGGDIVAAANDLIAATSDDDSETTGSVEDRPTTITPEEALQRWRIAVDAALLSVRDQRYQAFANSLNDLLQSAVGLSDGARTELAYLQCLAQAQRAGESSEDAPCSELEPPPERDWECVLSDRFEKDPFDRLVGLGEECVPGYTAIEELGQSWRTGLEEFDARDDLYEPDDIILDAIRTAGRIRELDDQLTVGFEEDLKEAQDCNEEALTTGCVTLLLPDTQVRPTVGISVAGEGASPAVDVKVKAEEIADGDSVALLVASGTEAADAVPIMATVMGSNGAGSAAETFRVPLDPKHTYVCALSSIQRSSLTPTRLIVEMPTVRIGWSPVTSSDSPVQTKASDLAEMGSGPICVSPPQTSGFTEIVIP